MRTCLWKVALAVALLPVAAAASPGASGSLLQNPSFTMPLVSVTPTTVVAAELTAPPTLALASPFVGGVGYRPRAYRSRASVMPTTTQVHVGFFDPTDGFSTGFVGGFRMGPQVDPRVQIGVAVDWWHRSDDTVLELPLESSPGGGVSRELVLSRSTADLVPILAFVQLSGDENMSIIPYGGFGVGYECLFLDAEGTTMEPIDEVYGGFGWQAWAGAGLPLDGHTRLNAEVFVNGSKVGSDTDEWVEGYDYPVSVREVVKMDGVGMRFGISWGF